MEKITKKQAMDILKDGWVNIGHIPKDVDVLEILKEKADAIEAVVWNKIKEIKSTEFVDDMGVHYDYKGQNYIVETEKRKYMLHEYPSTFAVRIII